MKKFWIFLFCCINVYVAVAGNQEIGLSYTTQHPYKKKKKSAFERERLLLGPGFGFGAGNRAFSINLSPSLAYCFTENFHIGTTLSFNYFQQAEEFQYYNTSINQVQVATFKHKYPGYSFSVYARYILFDRLLLNIEPEMNNVKVVREYKINSSNGKVTENKYRLNVSSVLAGAGYTQKFSRFGYYYFLVCYDLVQNPNARYYQTLDYRAGVMLSLFNN